MSALFSAIVAARNALFDGGMLKPQRLDKPVISIGNLSVGGTGKTPFTILLAELLQGRGLRVDILSRGFGRKSSGVLVVVPEGDSSQFGDEPLMMARRLRDVPVIVGASRRLAGLEAERRFQSDVHLLDDGFQHRQLARDFDIVLIDERDLRDRLLPSGRLREPLGSLRRANCIVWGGPGDMPPLPASKTSSGLSGSPATTGTPPIWRVRRRIELPRGGPGRPFVFCAIASPHRFLRDLADAGVQVAGSRCFRDHHSYSSRDISALRRSAAQAGADGFLTTEKDAVKLRKFAGELPIQAVRLVTELHDPGPALDIILDKLKLKARR